MQAKRSLFQRIVMWWRGIVWMSDGGNTVVTYSGWIQTTDGKSTDAIPLAFATDQFIELVMSEISERDKKKLSLNILRNGLY